MNALKTRYAAAIDAAIAKALASRERETVEAADGSKAYAYPKGGGRIAWGVNRASDGFNIVRGIRRPDGTDEAVS